QLELVGLTAEDALDGHQFVVGQPEGTMQGAGGQHGPTVSEGISQLGLLRRHQCRCLEYGPTIVQNHGKCLPSRRVQEHPCPTPTRRRWPRAANREEQSADIWKPSRPTSLGEAANGPRNPWRSGWPPSRNGCPKPTPCPDCNWSRSAWTFSASWRRPTAPSTCKGSRTSS